MIFVFVCRYKRMYSKRPTNWYVVPLKKPNTYSCVINIHADSVNLRMVDKESMLCHREMLPCHPRHISRTMARTDPSLPPPPQQLLS